MLSSLGAARPPLLSSLGSSRPSAAVDWWLAGGIDPANCVAAWQGKGAASYVASLVNLANPGTYDAYAPINDPAWNTASGWTGEAPNNNYLRTGLVPVADQSWSWIFRFTATTQCYAFGSISYPAFGCAVGSVLRWYYNSGRLTGGNATSGVVSAAGSNAYYNGALVGTIPTQAGTNTNELGILALNFGGGNFSQNTPITIAALAVYSIDVTAYISDLTTAINAL